MEEKDRQTQPMQSTEQGSKKRHRRRPHKKGNASQSSEKRTTEPLSSATQGQAHPVAQKEGQPHSSRNRRNRHRKQPHAGSAEPKQRELRREKDVSIRSFAQAFADSMPELAEKKTSTSDSLPQAEESSVKTGSALHTEEAVFDSPVPSVSLSQPETPAPTEPLLPAEQPAQEENATQTEQTEVVGIHFRRSAKTYYFDPQGISYKKGEFVIASTANGMEYCEITTPNRMVPNTTLVLPLRPIVRRATADDDRRAAENRDKEVEAYNVCVRCIDERGLDMKLIDTEFSFDNSKLLFYYIAEERVDFRDLVKDLASLFRVRIEMRQIGIRDEAKMLGGLGSCGRPLCCSTFLPDFAQVSIKMAKEQGLSLNSAKISGTCGRLMCCLRFEHETYEAELKVTPKVDSLVRTENGEEGIVTDAHPLTGLVKVRSCQNPEEPVKVYPRESLTVLGYQKGAGAKLLAQSIQERQERAQKQARPAQKTPKSNHP